MTSEPTTTTATTTTDGDELDRVADRLVEQARTDGVALTGPGGLLGGLTKKVLETALAAELTDHLGYEPGDPRPGSHARNGTTPKTVRTDIGRPLTVQADTHGHKVHSRDTAAVHWPPRMERPDIGRHRREVLALARRSGATSPGHRPHHPRP
jgi:hypothetical protein